MAHTMGASLPETPPVGNYMGHKSTKTALVWYGIPMNAIRNTLATAWESYLVRLALLALALGAVPFYFLSLAVAHIGG